MCKMERISPGAEFVYSATVLGRTSRQPSPNDSAHSKTIASFFTHRQIYAGIVRRDVSGYIRRAASRYTGRFAALPGGGGTGDAEFSFQLFSQHGLHVFMTG